MSEVCFMASISGRVQGVGFRYHTQIKAQQLGLRGWVRNCADGRVEACICGPKDAVGTMQDWLKHGPDWAHVDAINFTPQSILEVGDFIIR